MTVSTFARSFLAASCLVSAGAYLPTATAGIPACGAGCTAPIASGGEATTTQAFGGINWAFGAGPELVVGVRSVRTNARNKVVGAKVEATFPFANQSLSFDKLRLRLITGNRMAMAELGGGYSFAGKGFLASGAVQADYLVAGTDFTLNNFTWQPFIGVNTLGRPDEGSNGELTCSNGGALQDAATLGLTTTSDQVVNGKTCALVG